MTTIKKSKTYGLLVCIIVLASHLRADDSAPNAIPPGRLRDTVSAFHRAIAEGDLITCASYYIADKTSDKAFPPNLVDRMGAASLNQALLPIRTDIGSSAYLLIGTFKPSDTVFTANIDRNIRTYQETWVLNGDKWSIVPPNEVRLSFDFVKITQGFLVSKDQLLDMIKKEPRVYNVESLNRLLK